MENKNNICRFEFAGSIVQRVCYAIKKQNHLEETNMKKLLISVALTATVLWPMGASAQQSANTSAAPAPYYSTKTSKVADLLANPETKAVLEQDIPKVIHDERISMGMELTLREIQPYAGSDLSDEILAKVDADLAKVPAPK